MLDSATNTWAFVLRRNSLVQSMNWCLFCRNAGCKLCLRHVRLLMKSAAYFGASRDNQHDDPGLELDSVANVKIRKCIVGTAR